MQQEYYPAAEKILSDIENILKKDTKLSRFEIIPVTKNENKSPVHHTDHCLGLEKWCVPHLYCHAYNCIISSKQNKIFKEDPWKISKLLMGALLINPDITTFWNMRKDLICRGKIDVLFELHLTAVTLSRKPKCDDIFNHRKWIIKRMMKEFEFELDLVRNELDICEMAADRYANNYHAWCHRLWCLNQAGNDKLLISEWLRSHRWVSSHVSDYSGFHYRQILLNKLCSKNVTTVELTVSVNSILSKFRANLQHINLILHDDLPACAKLLISELLFSADLITTFAGHEALWMYRRSLQYLLHNFSASQPNHQNNDGVPVNKHVKTDYFSENFLMGVILYEKKFIYNILNVYNDCRQKSYAQKYLDWMDKILNVNINSV